MGFVTLEAIDGESAPRLFQLSDSVLTLKRLFSVFGMALRLPGGAAGAEWCSADNPNWVRVLTDGDVAAMFAVATAIKPKNVKVRDWTLMPAASRCFLTVTLSPLVSPQGWPWLTRCLSFSVLMFAGPSSS